MTDTTEVKSIVDDDCYSEVFLDIEKGEMKSTIHTSVIEEKSSVEENIGGGRSALGSESMSIDDVYKQDRTNDHFATKLALELEHIKNQQERHSSWKKKQIADASEDRYYSNSPLTMSLCSSNGNSDYDDSLEQEQSFGSKKKTFRKITYQEVEESLNKHYTKELQLSSEIDILLTYLKGQKHIFKQASRVTEQKFNFLMVPAIFMTGTMTVVAPFMTAIGWSGYVFSVLNALLTVSITINNFMKFQAKAAIYLSISNQYDKLGISVEMTRNHYLFVEDGHEKSKLILEKMSDTEKKIMTIQNNYNDNIIPYEVQLMNPVISNINIFSFIKKIDQHKKNLIMDYKDVKNNIRYTMFKWNKEQESFNADNVLNERRSEEIEKMQKLLEKKELLKNLLIKNNSSNVYSYIDNLFIREIQHSEHYYTYRSAGMYLIIRPKPLELFKYGNEVVDDYLNFIFTKTSS